MSVAHIGTLPRTHQVARVYLQLVSSAASAALGTGASILLGFNPLPSSFPLVALVRSYTLPAAAVGGLLIALVAAALALSRRETLFAWFSVQGGARMARFAAATLLSTVGSAALSILFGVGTLPSSIPLLNLIRTHPPLGIGLIALLLALIIFAPLLMSTGEGLDPPRARRGGASSPVLVSTSLSVVSSVLFVALLAMVLVRPTWCPDAICPPPVVVHNPSAVYDASLEVFPTAVQSATFQIPGEPSAYSVPKSGLPEAVPALRQDVKDYPPYRAVVGLHSLRLGRPYEILIEQVAVIVDRATPAPDPLNVWNAGEDRDYGSDPWEATYRGEAAGAVLQAYSATTPTTQVYLRPGETDEIDLRLVATQPGEMVFRVQVTYRVTDRPILHTLTLPHQYHVIFGTGAHWHVYQLHGGGFAAAS